MHCDVIAIVYDVTEHVCNVPILYAFLFLLLIQLTDQDFSVNWMYLDLNLVSKV